MDDGRSHCFLRRVNRRHMEYRKEAALGGFLYPLWSMEELVERASN